MNRCTQTKFCTAERHGQTTSFLFDLFSLKMPLNMAIVRNVVVMLGQTLKNSV
jgi:hypothetical protein